MSQSAEFTSVPRLRLFNTPLECGFRMLFLLHVGGPRSRDLQRLVSYDYLLVHSGDANEGPASLHPAVPFRGSEWLVKRDVISAGLNQMFSRGLLRKHTTSEGIVYQPSELTGPFIDLLKAPYAKLLLERAHWIESHFGDMSDDQLESYMSENIGRWGAEFERLTALKELDFS